MNEPPLTIDEFCRRHKICRATFYNWKKSGLGPREMRVGSVVRITAEAETEWMRRAEGRDAQVAA